MAKKPVKKPEYPEESRICGLIFICQLIAVLSAVSIVYLTVASYVPSIKAIASTYEEYPVICTTTLADDSVENCTWLSCFEWCLTKSSGLCMQIWVSVRQNGSELSFDQCQDRVEQSCATDDLIPSHRHLCRKDQCENLLGLFNCTNGVCVNVTSAMTCNKFTNLGHQISLKQRINCQALDGFYTCTASYCMEILKPYSCDRRCSDMTVHDPQGSQIRNVILFNNDRLVMAGCHGLVSDRPSGEVIWNPVLDPEEILMVSCTHVGNGSPDGQLLAVDCVNASLVQANYLKDNFSLPTLMSAYQNSIINRRLPSTPQTNRQVPLENELVIYNRSKLLVNLEFCVNTLRDECREFFAIHGRDGRDLRSPARFPCYYAPDKNDSVITKFNRNKVIFDFALSAAVPGVLFVFSCSCLVLCTRIVGIGPDAHMQIMGFRRTAELKMEASNVEAELLPNDSSNRNGKKHSSQQRPDG
ncbi:uncharacterized protein LOC130704464 [Daphnia carinata]|uniref:uncharacterized protein LOC130704464 n=1 Tax=Daphnia carinata TaxID=120202 RepID=UPI00257F2682|nr:uncharacterized protein LOC130704464 [Daphnia carinata]